MPDFRAYVRAHLTLPLSGARETEIVEELALEVEEHYQDAIREGLSPEEAWELVRRRSPEWREVAREIALALEHEASTAHDPAGNSIARLWDTLRFAMRLPRRSPGFTIAAVLVIALGVGPATAMFSAVYSVFLAPPPWAGKGELVVLWGRTSKPAGSYPGTVDGADASRVHISPVEYEEFKAQSTLFRDFAAAVQRQVTLDSGSGRPESIWIQAVTPGFLTMTGATLRRGRDFLPEEGIEGRQFKAVISNTLWKERFASDPQIVSKRIRLDGEAYTIVGVRAAEEPESRTQSIWTALAVRSTGLRPHDGVLTVIGRLNDGVRLDRAQAELAGIVAREVAAAHGGDPRWSVRLEPYRNDWLTARARANLWLLMCAVGFVLLVACVNVANLLLARGAAREKEMAVRASLGATQWQLFRQTLAGILFLFACGGMVGAAMGWAVLRIFLVLLPVDAIHTQTAIRMNIPALLFAGAVTLLTGLIFGCVPAWRAARVDVDRQLKQGGGAGKPRHRHRLSRLLVVAECSLTITLLGAAGMAVETWWTRSHLELGIRTDHILTFELQPQSAHLPTPERVASFYRELMVRIGALPGVKSATALNTWGLLREPGSVPFALGHEPADVSKLPKAAIRVVTPDFFSTFGVPVLNGRAFTNADRTGGEPVAMVNETFARRYLGGRTTGQSLFLPAFPLGAFRIAGVYRDVQNAAQLGQPNSPELCLSFNQVPQRYAIVAVRTPGDPAGVVKAVAQAINAIEPGLPMARIATMEDLVRERLGLERFEAMLLGAFGVLALLLAMTGIHGVMAFITSQERGEIGLRIALGASPSRIGTAVLRQGVGLAAAGLAMGAGFAWYGGRLMQSTLYGTQRIDPATLAVTAGILLAAAALGCGIPAMRAAGVDPMVAMRGEQRF